MSQIKVTGLTFAYEGSYDNIFENASFQIDSSWRLGFVGRNGRGKTTFLKLLLGKYEYGGAIESSEIFEYFPYEVQDKTQLTIEIIDSIKPEYEQWQLYREMNLLGVSVEVLYRPFETLSNGERTKVLLALLFLGEDKFLLIDEPTNHLDMEAREKIAEYLNTKKGFILVSHDRSFLDRCVDHIISINKSDIEVQKGNFTSWYDNKMTKDNSEIEENRKLKEEIKRLEEANRRTSGWSEQVEKTKKGTRVGGLRPDRGYIGHKAAKMMKRAKSIENRKQTAVEEKTKLLKNIESTERLKISELEYYKDKLGELKDVDIGYDGRIVCKNISFDIMKGDRICISGKNGSGKSSILKLIMGEEIEYSGEVRMGSQLKISYVCQDTSMLKGNLKDFVRENGIDEVLFKAILRKLDFDRVMFEKDICDFSQGQKKKVVIAKSLCERAHLYIWDEPLNYVDIFSRIQIEELLTAYKPTMIFVEHDRIFAEKIADKWIMT